MKGSISYADVYRCESGRCSTLPFFLTYLLLEMKQSYQTEFLIHQNYRDNKTLPSTEEHEIMPLQDPYYIMVVSHGQWEHEHNEDELRVEPLLLYITRKCVSVGSLKPCFIIQWGEDLWVVLRNNGWRIQCSVEVRKQLLSSDTWIGRNQLYFVSFSDVIVNQ